MANVSIAGRAARAGVATTPVAQPGVLVWIAVGAALLMALLAPALWNGFPLLFPRRRAGASFAGIPQRATGALGTLRACRGDRHRIGKPHRGRRHGCRH